MKSEYTLSTGTITHNLEAVKAEIAEKTQEYATTVVTPDNIKDSKKFLTDIRKERKVLDDQRKEVKKAWMKPFEDFEKEVKQVISLYDVPINSINGQLKAYEEDRKQEKVEELKELHAKLVPFEIAKYLPFDRVFRSRWLNATCSEKDVTDDIQSDVIAMEGMIKTLQALESEWEDKGLEELERSGDLHKAIMKVQEMQKQAEYIRELEQVATESVADVEQSFVEDVPTVSVDPMYVFYSVDIPKDVEKLFIEFCNDNNIDFERM